LEVNYEAKKSKMKKFHTRSPTVHSGNRPWDLTTVKRMQIRAKLTVYWNMIVLLIILELMQLRGLLRMYSDLQE